MITLFKCKHCGKITSAGHYDYEGRFTCVECAPLHNYLHFDEFSIINNKVQQTKALSTLSPQQQREKLISLIHIIFNNKVNKGAYRLINNYLNKGYSYLDMIRALEYFYIVKKNSIVKSNNNIGIIPYILKESQEYYQTKNNQLLQKYLQTLAAQQQEVTKEVVSIIEEKKSKQIDMNSL